MYIYIYIYTQHVQTRADTFTTHTHDITHWYRIPTIRGDFPFEDIYISKFNCDSKNTREKKKSKEGITAFEGREDDISSVGNLYCTLIIDTLIIIIINYIQSHIARGLSSVIPFLRFFDIFFRFSLIFNLFFSFFFSIDTRFFSFDLPFSPFSFSFSLSDSPILFLLYIKFNVIIITY